MASSEQQTEIGGAPASSAGARDSEIVALHERVAALEAELAEVHSRANAAIAAAQDRAYWIDRWHLDLNTLMRRPWANRLRAVARALRVPLRLARQARRQLPR